MGQKKHNRKAQLCLADSITALLRGIPGTARGAASPGTARSITFTCCSPLCCLGTRWQVVLTPTNPHHQVTFPPSKSPPLPSHSHSSGCIPPFCSPPSDPKLLLNFPARQGPCKLPGFKRSTCPERMGSLHQRGAWGSQGKHQGWVPLPGSLPQERFPGAKQRAQARAGQRDTPKSYRHIPTPLPSFIPSKEEIKMCLLLSSSSQRERDKGKKKKKGSCVMALETS